jgi:hypothetical protein
MTVVELQRVPLPQARLDERIVGVGRDAEQAEQAEGRGGVMERRPSSGVRRRCKHGTRYSACRDLIVRRSASGAGSRDPAASDSANSHA